MIRKAIWTCVIVGLLLIVAVIGVAFTVNNNNHNHVEPTDIAVVDSDGDGRNDWFETNIAGTDPQVYNARFVILVYVDRSKTHDAPISNSNSLQRVKQPLMEFFVEKEKIPAENVFLLVGNWEDGATPSNFEEAVSRVAQRSDAESLVFVFLSGHGGGDPPVMWFADGKGYEVGDSLRYTEIGEVLNEIECKEMLVGVFSCARERALEPLARGALYPRAVVYAAREIIGAMGEDIRFFSISDVIYGNGDGYVSLAEAADFLINDFNLVGGGGEKPFPPEKIMSDESNIAPTIYLGDYIPEGYAQNRVILTELKETGQYQNWYDSDWQLVER